MSAPLPPSLLNLLLNGFDRCGRTGFPVKLSRTIADDSVLDFFGRLCGEDQSQVILPGLGGPAIGG